MKYVYSLVFFLLNMFWYQETMLRNDSKILIEEVSQMCVLSHRQSIHQSPIQEQHI